MSDQPSLTSLRIDKWLWAVRLFKTRTLAADQYGTYKREIEVLAIFDKRVSAPLAQTAYEDSTPEEIVKLAKEVRSENKVNRQNRKEGDQGRMTKKQRRDWRKGLGSSKNSE